MSEQISTLEVMEKERDKPALTHVDQIPVLVLPPDWSQASLEALMTHPPRIDQTVELVDFNSFIEYVSRFKNESSLIFLDANRDGFELTAVFDYHSIGNAEWCCHLAVFSSTATPAWRAWKTANCEYRRQSDFAGFIYRNKADIVEPKGADLLEIVEKLKATAKGEFQDVKDLTTGSVEMVFRMKISTSGGTADSPISLPRQIDIRLVPFYGVPAIGLTADLMIRAPRQDGSPLTMAYEFYRPQDVFEELVDAVAQKTVEETGLPVLKGKL